jgi:hypothetical protein
MIRSGNVPKTDQKGRNVEGRQRESPIFTPILPWGHLSPGAQDQRDAMLARQLNRFSRGVESVDWNTKLLVAMLRYQIELDLSFLPEPVTDEERKTVTEKGARRFDRFEQWLMRQLADPENLYGRLQAGVEPLESKHFGEPDPS